MSGESEFVDVTYRGLKVAHRAQLRDVDGDVGFVEVEAPLPVGSRVVLHREQGQREASVIGVVEQEAGAKSPPGMRLSWAARASDSNGSASASAAATNPMLAAASSSEIPEAIDEVERGAQDGSAGWGGGALPRDAQSIDEGDAGMSGPIDAGASSSTDGKKRRGKKKGK